MNALKTITFDKSAERFIAEAIGLKELPSEGIGVIWNGKVYSTNICDLIQFADDYKKDKEIRRMN